jgi:predicted RNA-binding Zn-ribbon protein involved in translation (DUF1610 family)
MVAGAAVATASLKILVADFTLHAMIYTRSILRHSNTPMTSIDQMPVAFKCPACGVVVRTTRAFLLKPPLACPKCHESIELANIQADVKRSMENFGKTVHDLDGKRQ